MLVKLHECGCEIALLDLGQEIGLINLPIEFDSLSIELQSDLMDIAEKRVREAENLIDNPFLEFLRNIQCWFLLNNRIEMFSYLDLIESKRSKFNDVKIIAIDMIDLVDFPNLVR